jgi:phosphoadenosine phosphosulfate reductase
MSSPALSTQGPTASAFSRPASLWLPANYDSLSKRFERQHPREVIRWALTTYGMESAVATGFGPSGIVILHMVSGLRPKTTVFYLQTDLLFPETIELRDRLARRLGIQFTEVCTDLSLEEQAQTYGAELWQTNPDQCCTLRKVEPLRRFLSEKKAWMTAIRRDQSPTRASVKLVDWDKVNGLVKICPLAGWTRDQVWAYLREHNLPYNPLHDMGYPSIGCFPCTRPVSAGSDERAGRWAGTGKLECGIHVQPDGKIVRLANREEPIQ